MNPPAHPTNSPSAEPDTEPDDPKPGKKSKPGAKKPRRPKEVVPEEPDIFDQVRAHMNQQKAEEEARKIAEAAPKEHAVERPTKARPRADAAAPAPSSCWRIRMRARRSSSSASLAWAGRATAPTR